MMTRQDVLDAAREGCYLVEDSTAGALTRRDFLRVSLASTGGLLVAISWASTAVALHAHEGEDSADTFTPNAFIRVDPDDGVTIWSKEPEMGEGVRTSLPLIVAEELGADWSRVRIEDAPLDRERFGPQGVGGSYAVAGSWLPLRRAGAAGRALLVAAAAIEWNVATDACEAVNGAVRHPASGRTLRFGALAASAAGLMAPTHPERARYAEILKNPPLKDPAQFTLIGQRIPGVDNAAIVRGAPLFGHDVRLPGMQFAAVAKCPVFGGRPVKVDGSRALQVPGVRQVVAIHGLDNPTHLMSGVAVVADSTWAAFKGREALDVNWAEGAFAEESSASIREAFVARLDAPNAVLHNSGDVDQALAASAHRVEATFDYAFVSHATLEPHTCTADVRDGECWIRGPLQMPASGRQVVARALGIPAERVHVQSTRIGGGFGRRLLSDYAAEAAVVSRAAGVPVQIVESREGDLRHDYYRPASLQRVRAGLDARGRVVAWDHAIASVSRNAYRRDPRPPHSTEVYGSFIGGVTTREEMDPDLVPSRIPNARLQYGAPSSGVPTGAWRAPAHVVNAFSIETVLDELAAAARRSPVDLRLEILGEIGDIPLDPRSPSPYDPGRMARVLQEAAERGGIGGRAPEGRARGIAGHYTFYSYCAQVVELSVDAQKRVTIHRVLAVVDCGRAVNLSGLEAQVEGGVIDGLGAAFFCEVPIERGRAAVGNFDTYRLIRQREIPSAIDVVILPSDRHPTGIGEIPLPPIAPAVANAIAAATGERLRQMPFARAGYRL